MNDDPAAGSTPLPGPQAGRFPGFDVLSQAKHWDRATAAVVTGRLGPPPVSSFFTPAEEAIAAAVFDQILGQYEEPRVPVMQMVDQRLASGESDGWHYEDMPIDRESWRATLRFLDEDAHTNGSTGFASLPLDAQRSMLTAIQDLGPEQWHGMAAAHVWSLWTRYACTAFYSHPWAWNEIGFSGPAYPRGYKNIGIDRREPFEVLDVRPGDDPARGDA